MTATVGRTELGIVACRLCSAPMRRVLSLGHHPLADRFLTREDLDRPEVYYPLTVALCDACKYVGLDQAVSSKARYEFGEYSYTSGNSKVSRSHFAELAKTCAEVARITSESLVVDIGGNDGTFLHAIRSITECQVLNVDPSSAANLALYDRVPTIARCWGADVATSILESHGGADLIVSTNVLNHVAEPVDFVLDVARAIKPGARAVFEVPSLATLVRRGAWDTMYLEHVSYFSEHSLRELFRHEIKPFPTLTPYQFTDIEYMGGSLRCFVERPAIDGDVSVSVTTERNEVLDGLFEGTTWEGLRVDAEFRRRTIRQKIDAVHALGGKVVGIGAAAKGNTFLNYCGLTRRELVAIADASPHKIGKYTPGTHIPIISDEDIPGDVTHAICLPWNLAGFLREKLGKRFQFIEV